MSLASDTFNKTVFQTALNDEIDRYCEGILLYRRDHLKQVRELAENYSRIPAAHRDLEKVVNCRNVLSEAAKDGGLSINYDKGTVRVIPWAQLVKDFIANYK